MAQRIISRWRVIDQNKLAQRIKAQQLGQYDPPTFSNVRGLGSQDAHGNVSRDTAWRERVASHLANPTPAHFSQQDAEIEFQATLADEQLESAKRLSQE